MVVAKVVVKEEVVEVRERVQDREAQQSAGQGVHARTQPQPQPQAQAQAGPRPSIQRTAQRRGRDGSCMTFSRWGGGGRQTYQAMREQQD